MNEHHTYMRVEKMAILRFVRTDKGTVVVKTANMFKVT